MAAGTPRALLSTQDNAPRLHVNIATFPAWRRDSLAEDPIVMGARPYVLEAKGLCTC